MMIRRYIVKDMPEAVVLIRKELGKDAVILSSKRITLKKWMGFWRYKRLEVLAATGDDVPVHVHRTPAEVRPRPEDPSSKLAPAVHTAPTGPAVAGPGERELSTAAAAPTLVAVADKAEASGELGSSLADVRRQIEDMKRLLETTVLTPSIRPPLMQQLIRQGVADEHVMRIMEQYASRLTTTGAVETLQTADKPSQREAFVEIVQESLQQFVEPQPINASSRVVVMVGPTGVGKTTTIAKLAALNVLSGKRKVGLLTADTYRIAAVDQLRTYANILNVPLEVVYDGGDVKKALDRLSDRDLILVDTAGRNFRMDMHVQEVQQLLNNVPVDETYLVLSMATKAEDLSELTECFSRLPFDKFLFTKLDETSTHGAILNLLYSYQKPLSYITTGQNVPDDIEVASFDKILRLILGGVA